LLYAAGAGDRLVGVARHSDYPPTARALPRIGDAHQFDLERILSLEPDLVVAWKSGNPAGQIAQLRELQLPLYISEPRTLEDIPATIEDLGTLAGTATTARQAAEKFRERLAALQSIYAGRRPVRVFYQIWHEPLMTIGGGHLINEVIGLCGGRNVFHDIGQLAPQVSVESVLAAEPEVIIASGSDHGHPAWLEEWRAWPQLPAVRNNELHFIPPQLLQRHTPRILQGAERLCEILEQVRDSS